MTHYLGGQTFFIDETISFDGKKTRFKFTVDGDIIIAKKEWVKENLEEIKKWANNSA